VRTGFRAAAGPRVGLCVLPPASPRSFGLGARGHAAECKSSRRSGGLSRACRAVPLRPTPPAGVDFGRLPAPPQT